MADQTTISIDQETKNLIVAIADREGRTQREVVRRMAGGMYLGDLPPFDLAILHQVAKDEGLDSLLQAVSLIIREWQAIKQAAPQHPTRAPGGNAPQHPAVYTPAACQSS